MSESPKIAQTVPVQVELLAGKEIWFCTCGQSASQPFCDGSHNGTSFTPLAYTPEKDRKAWLCQCKRTGNPPFCDGSHKDLV